MGLSGRFLHRWSAGLWLVAGLCAAAAGVAIALWRAPNTVDLPVPASSGAEAPPAWTEAPPSLAAAQLGKKPSIDR